MYGAYGLTCANNKIDRPHIFLTVKKDSNNDDVLRDLKEKFNCDNPRKCFELLQEPDRKPKVKFLGQHQNGSSVEAESSMSVSSTQPVAPGCGVFSCTSRSDTFRNHMRIPEENENIPEIQGTGTLTIFCYKNGKHYALTCFHVGCANDENRLNASINKKDNILKISHSVTDYATYAEKQNYCFQESPVEDNNESISYGDDGSKYKCLGDFDNYHFDDQCDIMSLKISDDIEINCKVADVTPPDWDEIWNELYERVTENPGQNPVEVKKVGFKSGLTQGHVFKTDFAYEGDVSFYDATVVKDLEHSGPFLEGGDSGSVVFFHDRDNQKKVFAYGVFEMDELHLPEQHEPLDSTGPYYICYNLETALETLGFKEAACFSVCTYDLEKAKDCY